MDWLKKLVSLVKRSEILPEQKDSEKDSSEDADSSEDTNSESANSESNCAESSDSTNSMNQLQIGKERFDENALNEQIMDDFFEKGSLRAPAGAGDNEGDELDSSSNRLKIASLPQFFAKHATAKFEPLKQELSAEFKCFDERRETLMSNLEVLRSAKLLNEQLPTRVLQIMEGNRESYIRQHQQFIKQCAPSSTITYRNCVTFCDYFNQNISRFAKQTAKSHTVLAEFFNNEVSAINKDVKNLSEINLQIRELVDDWADEFALIEQTKENITDLLRKTQTIAEIKEDIATTKEKLAASEQLKEKLQRELGELRTGDDFSQFNGIDSEKKRLWREIKSVEDDIGHTFGVLDRPLRKLQRVIVDNKQILDAYVANPLNALLEDHSLEIVNILQKLHLNVNDGTLGFVDKEKEKILLRIDELSKLTLAAKQTKYRELRGAMRILDEQLRSTRVLKDIDDATYKINHVQEQIIRLTERLTALHEQESKLALDDLKICISERLSKIAGKGVQVI
ncbi:hypothetical protein HY772_05495 [Candidatus Woesearchaeota archaeon]|nr:hypothetical protein [Candidatus Woesearchaeota archaeon]